MNCPKCDRPMIAVEYDYSHRDHYDGVSEYFCEYGCGIRVGRWTLRILERDATEPPYGGGHPASV